MPVAKSDVPAPPVTLGRRLDRRIAGRLASKVLVVETCIKACPKLEAPCHRGFTDKQSRVAESDHIAWPDDLAVRSFHPESILIRRTAQTQASGRRKPDDIVTVASTAGGRSEEHRVAGQFEPALHAIVPGTSVNALRLPEVR